MKQILYEADLTRRLLLTLVDFFIAAVDAARVVVLAHFGC